MRGIKKIAILAVVGVGAISCAETSFAIMSLPTGWYVEADGGYSKFSNRNYSAGSSISSSSGLGWNVGAGYKFLSYLAAEISYTAYAKTKIQNSATGDDFGKDTHYSYQAAIKGILPIANSGVEAFAKLGITRIGSHPVITNASDPVASSVSSGARTSTGAYFGLGADYVFMPNLTGILQWARARGSSGSTGTLDLYSIGVAYMIE